MPDPSSTLPTPEGWAEFDALHDNLPAWRAAIEALADSLLPGSSVVQMEAGTVLVALLGDSHALKLYPPFLRDHYQFEAAMLARVGGRLKLPTPVLVQTGERDAWPWILMTQLAGEPLTRTWPVLPEEGKCVLLSTLGAVAAEVHSLPVGEMAAHAPPWPQFMAQQVAQCLRRQTRVGLPAHLLAQVPDFVSGSVPAGPDVMLTGEYTPMNLLTRQGRLCGMYDFGDGLVGPREYDWLGPLAFLAAGSASRCQAFFEGYGVVPDALQRQALLRLLLLHRYSNLPAQLALPNWREARSFEELAQGLWPVA